MIFLFFIALALANEDRILMKEIETLLFRSVTNTTNHRLSPGPQLRCVGDNFCDHAPDTAICTQHEHAQWHCVADFDGPFEFGRYEVVCEGYNGTRDVYVLFGSCALEFHIVAKRPFGEVFRDPGALFVGALLGITMCGFLYAVVLIVQMLWRNCFYISEASRSLTTASANKTPSCDHREDREAALALASQCEKYWKVSDNV